MNILYLLIIGLLFLLSYFLTRSLLSAKLPIMDYPNKRSLHIRSVPRSGGIAIILSLLAGVALLFILSLVNDTPPNMENILFKTSGLKIIACSLIIGFVSFLDDWIGVPIVIRFSTHGVVVAALVWGTGLSMKIIKIPAMGALESTAIISVISFIFLIWMINTYNFMDGMDGLAGGMAVIGCSFLSYIGWSTGHYHFALLCSFIVATAGGFLVLNKPPAKIFMGDVGSTTLGYLIGILSIIGVRYNMFDIWVPLIIFSPFIVDSTITLFVRLLQGEKIWKAHRTHYYQRLFLSGWHQKKIILSEYCLMIICGLSAILYTKIASFYQLILLFSLFTLYVFLAVAIRKIEINKFIADKNNL